MMSTRHKIFLLVLVLSSIFIIQVSASNIIIKPNNDKTKISLDTSYNTIKMQTFNNSQRTISDSTQTIQIEAVFKNNNRGVSDNSSTTLKNIKVSRNPEQVVITKDNKFAFVRCYLSNTVELINIAKGERTKSFTIPSPSHLSLSNDGAKLIVASLTDTLSDPSLSPLCQ